MRYVTTLSSTFSLNLPTEEVWEGKHSERSAANNEMYVPENPRKWCTGFSYIEPKLYNMIPKDIKDVKTTDDFKTQQKGWI